MFVIVLSKTQKSKNYCNMFVIVLSETKKQKMLKYCNIFVVVLIKTQKSIPGSLCKKPSSNELLSDC
jgi:hypothetical protein